MDKIRYFTKDMMKEAIEDAADLIPLMGQEDNRYLIAVTLYISRFEILMSEAKGMTGNKIWEKLFPGGF